MNETKLQAAFRSAYEDLEKNCRKKCGVDEQGVLTYIERLNNATFAPERDAVLTRLVQVYDLYQRGDAPIEIASPSGGERIKIYGPTPRKADLRWTSRFARVIARKGDPLSRYLRRSRRKKRWRRFLQIGLPLIALAIIAAAAVWFFFFR